MPLSVAGLSTFLALLLFWALEDIAHTNRMLHLDLRRVIQLLERDKGNEGTRN